MKRGTPDHPKARALAARLGLTRYQIVGLLESLWHFAAGYAKQGDVGRYSDEEIADAIGWPVDQATEMVAALADKGWLDRCRCHRLRIHGWPEHADQSLRRAVRGEFLECYGLKLASTPDLLVTTSVIQPLADPPLPEPVPEPVPEPEPSQSRKPEPADGPRPSPYEPSPPKPNPFVQAGGRTKLERECLELVAKIAELRDCDPTEVFREASHYHGARKAGSPNPANLTDDRLLNTVLDLRAMLRDERAKRASPDTGPPPDVEATVANAEALAEEFRESLNGEPATAAAFARWREAKGISFYASVAARLLERASQRKGAA